MFGDTLPELVLANADGGAAVYRNTRGAFTLEGDAGDGPDERRRDGRLQRRQPSRPRVRARHRDAARGAERARVAEHLGASGQFFVSDELGAAATTALLVRDFDLDTRSDVLA